MNQILCDDKDFEIDLTKPVDDDEYYHIGDLPKATNKIVVNFNTGAKRFLMQELFGAEADDLNDEDLADDVALGQDRIGAQGSKPITINPFDTQIEEQLDQKEKQEVTQILDFFKADIQELQSQNVPDEDLDKLM